jgi:hypothetical protein
MKTTKMVTFNLFNDVFPIPIQEFNINIWWSKDELKYIYKTLINDIKRIKSLKKINPSK